MTGVAERTNWRIGHVRTGIEVAVLGIGWLLGGAVGMGTLLYALSIGPVVQRLLPRLAITPAGSRDTTP
jgi:uncharacterized membrane protein YczE